MDGLLVQSAKADNQKIAHLDIRFMYSIHPCMKLIECDVCVALQNMRKKFRNEEPVSESSICYLGNFCF